MRVLISPDRTHFRPNAAIVSALFCAGLALADVPAFACAVCGFGEDPSSKTFLYSTMALSLVPLGLIGGIIYWIRKTIKRPPQ